MLRTILTDDTWRVLSNIMYRSGRVYRKPEHRMTLEGILYRLRTGLPWRDLPDEFGDWSTIFRRFNLWSKKGVLHLLFNHLSASSDSEWLFIDGSIIKAHQHGSGSATEYDESIGKSKGGHTTKIHLAVDSYGLPVHFELTGGHRNDIVMAESLVKGSPKSQQVIADKGYDSESFRSFLVDEVGTIPVIPRRTCQAQGNETMDWAMYKYRHLVENAFARIKHYRAISTRYDKLERNYAAMLCLAFSLVWLPMHC